MNTHRKYGRQAIRFVIEEGKIVEYQFNNHTSRWNRFGIVSQQRVDHIDSIFSAVAQ